LSGRGLVLAESRRFAEALASYNRAVAIDRDYFEAFSNRGLVLQSLNRTDDALASYDRAIALKPDYADAFLNRAMCRLLVGRYVEGWADYEWRWAARVTMSQCPYFAKWQGDDQRFWIRNWSKKSSTRIIWAPRLDECRPSTTARQQLPMSQRRPSQGPLWATNSTAARRGMPRHPSNRTCRLARAAPGSGHKATFRAGAPVIVHPGRGCAPGRSWAREY
jgi:hypothetical protein